MVDHMSFSVRSGCKKWKMTLEMETATDETENK